MEAVAKPVSTISDECKRVGLEISTNPEQETGGNRCQKI